MDDIGEEDGGEDSFGLDRRRVAGDEFFDFGEEAVAIGTTEEVVGAGDFDEVSVGDLGGDPTTLLDIHVGVV